MKKFLFGAVCGAVLYEIGKEIHFVITNPTSPEARAVKMAWTALPLAWADPDTLTDDQKFHLMTVQNKMY